MHLLWKLQTEQEHWRCLMQGRHFICKIKFIILIKAILTCQVLDILFYMAFVQSKCAAKPNKVLNL